MCLPDDSGTFDKVQDDDDARRSADDMTPRSINPAIPFLVFQTWFFRVPVRPFGTAAPKFVPMSMNSVSGSVPVVGVSAIKGKPNTSFSTAATRHP